MSTVEDLFEKLKKLSQPQLLRLAAELIERGRLDLAEPIVLRMANELAAVRLLRESRKVTP